MIGGTGAWFSNTWDTQFFDNTNLDLVQKSDLKWNWSGGGLSGGGDIYMGVGSGFGFFADASFALLFGPMKEKERLVNTDADSDNTRQVNYNFNAFQPVVNVGVGVDYKHWFKDNVMIHLALGWEFTWWFNLNQFGRIVPDSSNVGNELGESASTRYNIFNNQPSDLGFHGLTARLGFEF